MLKWERHLLAGLRLVPSQLDARLELMWTGEYTRAVEAAESLLDDTVTLAEQHSDAQLSEFREALAARRKPLSVADLHQPRST